MLNGILSSKFRVATRRLRASSIVVAGMSHPPPVSLNSDPEFTEYWYSFALLAQIDEGTFVSYGPHVPT